MRHPAASLVMSLHLTRISNVAVNWSPLIITIPVSLSAPFPSYTSFGGDDMVSVRVRMVPVMWWMVYVSAAAAAVASLCC